MMIALILTGIRTLSDRAAVAFYIICAVILGLALYALYDAVYERGYEAAKTVAEAQMKIVQQRNDEAIAETRKVMTNSVNYYVTEKEKLNDELARLKEEAAADPDRDKCGLGANSVRRLNAIH